MYYFCTYFDKNYLPRGIALYRSLRKHCPKFKLWVLCMDREAYVILLQHNLPEMHLIPQEAFESGDTELLQAKQNRSVVEYYFTCTPSLPLFILKRYPEVDLITYLDADLFFFADPALLFSEINGKSIALISHRFPARLKHLEIFGIYNVGWLSFRRDENGLKCLHWWRDQCLEWCYDRLEGDRFADQKYLDRFPDKFGDEIVLQHKGANVGPWNIENYAINIRGDCIYMDDQPLIFYHFQGLKKIISWVYDLGLQSCGVSVSQDLMNYIYIPYLQSLQEPLLGKSGLKTLRYRPEKKDIIAQAKAVIKWWFMFLQGIMTRRFSFIFSFQKRENNSHFFIFKK